MEPTQLETIKLGGEYEFVSEVQEEYAPPENRLRRFTGQKVTVLSESLDRDPETSRIFNVRAQDGTAFQAWEEELNGWDKQLGQYFHPDATYGPDRETWALVNERN